MSSPDEPNLATPGSGRDKPYPRFCPACGKVTMQLASIPYDARVKHDGRLHTFKIPALQVDKCEECGEILFGNRSNDQVSQALRAHLKLLSPEQIRQGLRALGLKQKELGERIGVAPETISRWVGGEYIQSRPMDNLMRLFFAFDNVRAALAASTPSDTLGVIGSPEPAAVER